MASRPAGGRVDEQDLEAGGSAGGPGPRTRAPGELQRPEEGDAGLGCGLESPIAASAVEPQAEFGRRKGAGPRARLVALEVEEHGQAPGPEVGAPRAEGRGHGGVVLQELHSQHEAASEVSTQGAGRGRVVGTEVDAQQADSQGRPRGVIVAQTSGGGREQPADDGGIRIRGGRSRRRRRRRRLRLRPRPRPRALLETSLQLSHDARVQSVALFKLGGEVGRVLPL